MLRLAALYKAGVELGVVLLPLAAVGYLYVFQDPPQVFHDPIVHAGSTIVSLLLSLFAAFMAYRCFLASGEPSMRYITLALLGYTLVHVPHGLLEPYAGGNVWLFVLYGPASRVVMTAFLLEALTRHGEAPEPVARRSDPMTWLGWLAAVVVLDVAVAVLATLPVAGDPHIRLTMEGLAITLSLGGIVAIRWRRLCSGLMGSYQVAMLAFAVSCATFLLAPAWTHLWWMAHALFAGGFFLLSHGLARVLLTSRSIADVRSETEMVACLAGAEAAAAQSRAGEERLRALLDTSPIGVMVTAADGRILFCNRRHAETLGVPAAQLLGRDAAEFVRDGAQRRRVTAEALSSGRTVSAQVEIVTTNGARRRHVVQWTPMMFAGERALVSWGMELGGPSAAPTPIPQPDEVPG